MSHPLRGFRGPPGGGVVCGWVVDVFFVVFLFLFGWCVFGVWLVGVLCRVCFGWVTKVTRLLLWGFLCCKNLET